MEVLVLAQIQRQDIATPKSVQVSIFQCFCSKAMETGIILYDCKDCRGCIPRILFDEMAEHPRVSHQEWQQAFLFS